MADTVGSEKRSAIMRAVKQKNTAPEMIVRRTLHEMGYRFRLHRKDLPGTPDIVLPKYRLVIFVHGCFWHGHKGCRLSRRPTDNADFWNTKLDRNLERDIQSLSAIEALGWQSMIVWQCQTRDRASLRVQLQQYLNATGKGSSAEADQ